MDIRTNLYFPADLCVTHGAEVAEVAERKSNVWASVLADRPLSTLKVAARNNRRQNYTLIVTIRYKITLNNNFPFFQRQRLGNFENELLRNHENRRSHDLSDGQIHVVNTHGV
jgi:hypothetical protein